MGLSLNVKKTECMGISKKSSKPKCNLVNKGEKIKQVTKFKYLGYLITSDGICTSETSKRIAMAKDTFQKMKPILAKRNISVTTKIRVIKTYVCLEPVRLELPLGRIVSAFRKRGWLICARANINKPLSGQAYKTSFHLTEGCSNIIYSFFGRRKEEEEGERRGRRRKKKKKEEEEGERRRKKKKSTCNNKNNNNRR
ncbi:endonuclease-reverse transcriptase [Plakobranchus ocellatus]|uniref:Endonuclease-reverse transcriptase n=1 Tax=Plakobranchus ocellatus TaxID=259542 RepID=A0AAV3Y635_9GAST|nr:endonuclease-reverse transcriptase [Plakobranchus ocellatus]